MLRRTHKSKLVRASFYDGFYLYDHLNLVTPSVDNNSTSAFGHFGKPYNSNVVRDNS